MADVQTSEVMQNLHHSTQNHEILYSDRPSEDEQILRKTKNTNMAGG
jgi:hypothetical protein